MAGKPAKTREISGESPLGTVTDDKDKLPRRRSAGSLHRIVTLSPFFLCVQIMRAFPHRTGSRSSGNTKPPLREAWLILAKGGRRRGGGERRSETRGKLQRRCASCFGVIRLQRTTFRNVASPARIDFAEGRTNGGTQRRGSARPLARSVPSERIIRSLRISDVATRRVARARIRVTCCVRAHGMRVPKKTATRSEANEVQIERGGTARAGGRGEGGARVTLEIRSAEPERGIRRDVQTRPDVKRNAILLRRTCHPACALFPDLS